MRSVLLGIGLCLALAGCGAEPVWAPDEAVEAAVYRNDEPASITLYTMVSNRSNEGAHSGLLINGSQRLMFDPAGSWYHRTVPERNDVHFGMTDRMLDFYIDYHARETFRVVEQTIEVSPEVAEQAIAAVQGYGAVPKAMCGVSTSRILSSLPGFESIGRRAYPGRIMARFAELPGVQTDVIYQDDADNNSATLVAQAAVE